MPRSLFEASEILVCKWKAKTAVHWLLGADCRAMPWLEHVSLRGA